jgi:hypothetical protein
MLFTDLSKREPNFSPLWEAWSTVQRAHKMFHNSVGKDNVLKHGVLSIARSKVNIYIRHTFYTVALLILNNSIILLHAKLKRVPEKKLRNTDVEKILLALLCDYNSTTVAHDTHQTSL